MSIQDDIKRRCDEGRLYFLPTAMSHLQVVRHMFVSPDIYKLAQTGPWKNSIEERRFGQLRANLDEFTQNATLTVAWNPFTARNAYFGRLYPVSEEVWDIRSRDPSPAIRVLGSFADTDLFVALEWGYRSEWGDRNSQEWRDARIRTGAYWRRLFPSFNPLTGDQINDYLTNAVPA